MSSESRLSRRAEEQLKAANPLMEIVLAKLANMYNPNNPNGLINIGIAENSLMHEWLTKYYNDNFALTYDDFTYGLSMNGSPRLLDGLSKLFQKHFDPIVPVDPKHIVVGAGASAVLDQLAGFLCDEKETILLAKVGGIFSFIVSFTDPVQPYYNGFDNDIATRNNVTPVGVDLDESLDIAGPEALSAFEKVLEDPERPKARAIILTNPNNPLGFCYPRETIIAYMKLAEKYNVHLIVDEIYALSVFETKSDPNVKRQPFISALSIDPKKEAGCDPSRIHIVYGMSKDFCANGLRIGVLVSQSNPRLMSLFMASVFLMKISSASDALWTQLLHDEQSLTYFISENQKRLADAYDHVVEFLNKRKIPHTPSYSGVFMWIDLRSYLSKGDEKGEKKELDLFMRLLEEQNLYLAPGVIYHSKESGFFRLTFAMRRDYLDLGLERLSKVLDSIQL